MENELLIILRKHADRMAGFKPCGIAGVIASTLGCVIFSSLTVLLTTLSMMCYCAGAAVEEENYDPDDTPSLDTEREFENSMEIFFDVSYRELESLSYHLCRIRTSGGPPAIIAACGIPLIAMSAVFMQLASALSCISTVLRSRTQSLDKLSDSHCFS